jgi:hypothetical protein
VSSQVVCLSFLGDWVQAVTDQTGTDMEVAHRSMHIPLDDPKTTCSSSNYTKQ